MARTPMGGTSGDTVVQKDPVSGDYEPADGSKKLDVYTAYTGGTHVTDLQTPSGTAITYLSLGAGIDSNTGIADFLSKDGDQIDYYLQDQDNPTWARVLVRPKTLTAMVAGSGVSSIKLGSGGTPLTGPVEIDLTDLVALGVAPKASPAFSGTPTGLAKSHVGLANVDNTSDANKPISTATQAELDQKLETTEVSALIAAATDGLLGNFLRYLVWNETTSLYPNRSESGTSDPDDVIVYLLGPGPVKSGTGSTGSCAGDVHAGVA